MLVRLRINPGVLIQCYVNGHWFMLFMDHWCPDTIAHWIQYQVENPGLDFYEPDGINLSVYLGKASGWNTLANLLN